MNDPLPAAKPSKLKRGLLWGLGGFFGLAILGTLLDPNAGKPRPTDPNKPTARAVDDLREAMHGIGEKPQGREWVTYAIAIPKSTRAIDLEAAAKARCNGLPVCAVYGWSDPNQLPGTWPLLDREVAAMMFHYGLNRNTGYEQTDWFCGSPGAKPDCVKPGVE